jgi:hypothetical protein
MATEAIHDWAGHLLATAREGRFATTLLRALVTDARDSAGLTYELPPMAVADAIDAVIYVDTSGGESRLDIIPAAMLPIFTSSYEAGTPSGYAFFDGTIRIYPRPTVGGSLKIQYPRRHGQLTTTSATDYCSVISFAANGTQTDITVSVVPSTFVVGAWIDLIGLYHPHRTKLHGLRITNVAGSVVRVNAPLADLTAAGAAQDTLTIYGKTPYLSLPLELKSPLCDQIVARILVEVGDRGTAQDKDAMSARGAMRVKDLLSPRAKSQPEKMFSPNSLMRGGMSRRRWSGL